MTGPNVKEFFSNEAGSHCWQRIPPTEKKGRLQTSTITVAVMDPSSVCEYVLDPNDVSTKYCRSGGKGGQNVNKVETCVVLTHHPSGIMVRSEETRHRAKNEVIAWERLVDKLSKIHDAASSVKFNDGRADQIGNGQRCDKRRTYRVKDNLVVDHVNGRNAKLKDILRGNLGILHR